jgi:LDH2 family malate/lactate/ureidoglycolate dehydrogenase
LSAFMRQMDFLAAQARNTPPRTGSDGVRLPGERGLQRYREQLANGVLLYPTILPALGSWAKTYDVATPDPLSL